MPPVKIKIKVKRLIKQCRVKDLFGAERGFLMSDSKDSNNKERPSTPYDNASTAPAPTVAAFSPNQQTATRRNQASVLIHQKSPLLVSTPPEVTRALAYSHPFILPLNKLMGLLAWRTDDPWESFLFMTVFWFLVLYGDIVLRWAGPIVLVTALVLGMWSRRYSPLSSTMWSDARKSRKRADSADQRKSLDEILHTLYTFTESCDILLDPFIRLTEYLSTQSTATSATTRPALTTLFIRILAFTPIWIALTLPPLYLITTKRLILVLGTVGLSWHSQPARVSRTILWRSQTIRTVTTFLTGLKFSDVSTDQPPRLPPRPQNVVAAQAAKDKTRTKSSSSEPIRFTFTLFENQRRWIGLGWTSSLFSYERQAWTDEHLNTVPDPDHYELPETDNDTTKWRWVPGSEWHVEGANADKEKSAKRIGGGGGGDDSGWVYFDNKWMDGRKEDGWTRYTRRRKWVRDAELIEINPDGTEVDYSNANKDNTAETSSIDSSTPKKKGWFGRSTTSASTTGSSTPPALKGTPNAARHRTTKSASSVNDRDDAESITSTRSRGSAAEDEDVYTPIERSRRYEWDRSLNEGVAEQLS